MRKPMRTPGSIDFGGSCWIALLRCWGSVLAKQSASDLLEPLEQGM